MMSPSSAMRSLVRNRWLWILLSMSLITGVGVTCMAMQTRRHLDLSKNTWQGLIPFGTSRKTVVAVLGEPDLVTMHQLIYCQTYFTDDRIISREWIFQFDAN